MTVSFTFLLTGGTTGGGSGGVIPTFPTGGVLLACNAEAFDQDHFLDMIDRSFPAEYIEPLKDNVDAGYEVYEAFARIGERLSTAVKNFECGSFIIFAEGGRKAQVTVAFERPTAAAGAVTVKAGTVLRTLRHGRRFTLLEDVVFGGADIGPITGLVEAEAVGYEYNVEGLVITPSGISLEGEIQSVEAFVLEPAFGDQTLTVSQDQFPSTDGKCADLDGLGSNRDITRLPNESDDVYRLRIRSLPDVVTRDAVERQVAQLLAGARVTLDFAICETFEHVYQECYDAPSPNPGTPSYDGGVPPLNPDYDDTTFVYDDPRVVATPQDFCRNRTMDGPEYRGAFVVVVPLDTTLIDVGMAYDDPGMVPSDFLNATTGVRRGTPAYDITNDDNVSIMTACYDGFDIERRPLYAALFDLLQRIKAAGVAAVMDTVRD